MKKKICVIFTGGTIGSATSGTTVDLMNEDRSLLIDRYCACFGNAVSFDSLRPLNILSENVQFSDVRRMADCVRHVDKTRYDGIIITHGTDTLCFTANLFSQIFRDTPIPIVFVSALFPLDDKRGKGVENFAGAVDFIENEGLRGVFVSFMNERENLQIHLGSRLCFTDQITGKFVSVMDLPLCEQVKGRFVYHKSDMLPSKRMINSVRPPYGEYRLCKDVITIRARAFIDFSLYRFGEKKPKAVVCELFHSGTACTAGDETNVLKFIDYCLSCGILVILAPVDSHANVYASALAFRHKCIIAYDCSFEMTVVKVMLALGEGRNVEEELASDNFFEKIH